LGKAKKISIGIGIVFVIFVVIGTVESLSITQTSQVLDEMYAECNEKYPTQTEELLDCMNGAKEKWSEMFSDSPCLFLCLG